MCRILYRKTNGLGDLALDNRRICRMLPLKKHNVAVDVFYNLLCIASCPFPFNSHSSTVLVTGPLWPPSIIKSTTVSSCPVFGK
mmetsp:Transcript_12250/g.25953  ORF Transcript_12250/g.25953 Transcript_12250/m.25953 type:complete len:84 (+) Transcript_12250:723-974(+)